MSLSLLNRLTLLVHPHRVILECRQWRGNVTRQHADVALPVADEADWHPALSAASALLTSSGRRGNQFATLHIIVADHFVRYALLPWSDILLSSKARRGMALALLKNTLGERVGTLELTLSPPAFGRSGIAAGIERELLAGLRATAKAHRLRLASLQPRLLAELRMERRQLESGWFACIDSERLALVGVNDGDICCLHNHRTTTDNGTILSAELNGLLAAGSAVVKTRKLCISGGDVTDLSLAGDWEITSSSGSIGIFTHA